MASHDFTSDSLEDAGQDKESIAEVQFCPPLYIQRYMLAVNYLTKHSVQKVVDFGCSECGFFRLLSTVPSIQEISLVDIDRNLLKSNTRAISPQFNDYIYRRANPLSVYMYVGSAGTYDVRMKICEAVTLIEVIEHLNPDILQSVTENVFGNIHPKHVIVTTPNSEFNVLFGNEDPSAFRHWDHKFEWTRGEFQAWCHSVCELYNYEVEYSGVGFQTNQSESSSDSDVGPCSQAAFFCHQEEDDDRKKFGENLQELEISQEYELIATSEFPCDDNQMTTEEKLDLEIAYTLRQIVHLKTQLGDEHDDDDGSVYVGVSQIANRQCIKELADTQKVREYLKEKLYKLSEDGQTVILDVADFVYEEEDDVEDDSDGNISSCGKDKWNFDSNDDVDDGCDLKQDLGLSENWNDDVSDGGGAPVLVKKCDSDWDLSEKMGDGYENEDEKG